MSSRVELIGMHEFQALLRNLPDELREDAGVIVQATTDRAHGDVVSAYPQGPTGNLKRRVGKQIERSKYGASGSIKSRAPHSHLFEKGTKQRRNSRGANRGTMPAAPESQRMIPIVIRHRRRMVNDLIAMVERAGFKVTTT